MKTRYLVQRRGPTRSHLWRTIHNTDSVEAAHPLVEAQITSGRPGAVRILDSHRGDVLRFEEVK